MDMTTTCLARANSAGASITLPDTQAATDTRRIAIDRVGVSGLRHPILVAHADGHPQMTVAHCSFAVALPADQKGTHMSRFLALLDEWSLPLSPVTVREYLCEMVDRLGASAGEATFRFPWFRRKTAPVSGIGSVLDYDVTLSASLAGEQLAATVRVVVPVTSLCPCSKEISRYGAHNQRSHVTVTVRTTTDVQLGELIALCEAQASSEVYGLLKRADEKFVTERAYENPKFVEDLVRDVAAAIASCDRFEGFRVEAENFESIHNHSAYACIDRL